MLSVKSKAFIENLRLYLVTSGKKQKEINELIDELKVHLIEAEKQGKSIDEMIDCTPEQYMNSLKREMDTDYKNLIKNVTIIFAGVIAYLIMGSAIKGEFSLNIVQVIAFPLIIIAGLLIYVFFLQQAGKKQFSTKKLFVMGMLATTSVNTLFILVLLGSTLIVEPFYIGTTFVNWIVVGVCASILIIFAIWSKTWFSILIPVLLFIPDMLFRFSNLSDTTIFIIGLASFMLIFIFMIINLLIMDKRKKR